MRSLLLCLLLCGATVAQAQFPALPGFFSRFTYTSPNNLGVRLENRDTTGRVGVWNLLPTASGDTFALWTSRTRADILTSQPLYINGTLWPPAGGGGVWSTAGTKAYYNAGFVGVGIDDPVAPLSVRTQDNDQNTTGVLFRNLAGSFELEFRNDKFLALTGVQPDLLLDATTADPTGAALSFKRDGLTRGQILNFGDGLQLTTIGTGDLTLAAPATVVENGSLRVYNTASTQDLFGVRASDRRAFFGPVPQGESAVGIQNANASHRVGLYVKLDPTYSTPSTLGSQDAIGILVQNNTLANTNRANVGLAVTVGNPGSNGTAVPLRLYDGVNRTGQWLRVLNSTGDHGWYTRGRAQIALLVDNTATGRYSFQTGTTGTYVAFLDSADAGDFDVAAESLLGFTHDGSGTLTFTAPSGLTNQQYYCTATLSAATAINGTYELAVRVAGTVTNRTRVVKTLATGDGAQTITTQFITPLSNGTTIEPVVAATSANRQLNVNAFKLTCVCAE